jgi:hypothetical protein
MITTYKFHPSIYSIISLSFPFSLDAAAAADHASRPLADADKTDAAKQGSPYMDEFCMSKGKV